MRKKNRIWNRKIGNRRCTQLKNHTLVRPMTPATIDERMTSGYEYTIHTYTCMNRISALCTYIHTHAYIYICAHAFIYGRFRRVDRPDATSRRNRAGFARHGYRHERRLDLHTQLLQFNGKYTREPYIQYARWTLSRSRAPAVAVCIWESTSVRTAQTPVHLLHYKSSIFFKLIQIERDPSAMHMYAHRRTARNIQKYNVIVIFQPSWKMRLHRT